MIEKVNITIGPIQVTIRDLEPAGTGTDSGTWKSQLALFTTERQRDLRPAVAFSKACLKGTFMYTGGNFMKIS